MIQGRARGLMKALGSASAVAAVVMLAGPTLHAQGFMRGPNLNIGPRVNPNIAARVNPNVGVKVNPSIGVRAATGIRPRIGVGLHPYVRYSPNLYPLCNDVGGEAECVDTPTSLADADSRAQAQARRNGPRNGGAEGQGQ